ncbi:MAG TPA: lipid-binding SYLF domain-containing protein [candidate division Zixibacteria bacterium]|nr:lipid-binding SYLF domain-containing protein [candidate division Zixibacteria bacterium]
MRKFLALFATLFLGIGAALAGDRADDVGRLDESAKILSEIMNAGDKGIPEEIIGSAKCIAVVPSMLNGAFIIGANYGKGVTSCRTEKGWSAPAFFAIKGGSFGFQIGGQAVDLIILAMNDRGMDHMLASKFKMGADASVAAGPVGRHADASTDWKMRAEMLTYSRSRGVFAGISLNGAVISQHQDDTRSFYGRMVPFKTILTGNIDSPKDADTWRAALRKYGGSGVEKSQDASASK